MKKPHHPSRRAQAGLSLIEVLCAVLLVSFGILGLLSLLSKATQASVGSEDNLRAALLANELTSLMWNNNTVNLPAATITDWSTNRVGAATVNGLPNNLGLPGGSGTVAVTNGPNGSVARITVRWRTPAGTDRQYITDVVIP